MKWVVIFHYHQINTRIIGLRIFSLMGSWLYEIEYFFFFFLM